MVPAHFVWTLRLRSCTATALALLLCAGLSGCASWTSGKSKDNFQSENCASSTAGYGMACEAPRELRKVSLPEYMIEPPDVLLIESVNNIRPSFAPVRAGETLIVQVNRTIPIGQIEDPVSAQFKQINGLYVIGPGGI